MTPPDPTRDLDPDRTLAAPAPDGSAEAPDLAAALKGRFRLEGLLGRGGMGEVHAAEDLTLGRRVALKAIRPERRLAPEARERFLREARLLGRLDHPGICRIHDLVEAGDRDVLVLEFITGRTLREAADELNDRQRLDVALQIAAVLEAAHAEGVVHRDLKPDNIMLTADGQLKVLDFGLARDLAGSDDGVEKGPQRASEATFDADRTMDISLDLSEGGAVLGTPAYLSPEQAGGLTATTASDMYALGLVLQRLYTGQRAYEESDDLIVVLEQAREARTRPLTGVDRDVARLISGLLARSPAVRPTAAETRRRLAWIQRRGVRRARRWGIAAAVALIFVAGAKYTLDVREERRIADLHRTEAERLVEFMIGDLRERLEPVGRLDVLDEVGDRALEYFAARSGEERTPADQHRFARTMIQIGEVRLNKGDLDAAAEAFGEGRRTVQGLVDAEPDNGEWLLTLGAAEFWLGNVDYYRGDLGAAESRFLAYKAVAERLVSLDAEKEDWQQELGYAHTNLAALHEARGEPAAASEALARSIRIQSALAAADPTDPSRRADLINTLAWDGGVKLGSGRLVEADARYRLAVEEVETLLLRDPDDIGHGELASSVIHLAARSAELQGLDERSLAYYRRGRDVAAALVDHDPDNMEWRFSLVVSEVDLGRALVQRKSFGEAVLHVERGAELAFELAAAEPTNTDFRRYCSVVEQTRALMLLGTGDMGAAARSAARGVAIARENVAASPERDPVHALASGLLVQGRIADAQGRGSAAGASWSEARELLAPLARDHGRLPLQDTWLRALVLTGERDQALDVFGMLSEAGYAKTDLVEFCRSQGIGAAGAPNVRGGG